MPEFTTNEWAILLLVLVLGWLLGLLSASGGGRWRREYEREREERLAEEARLRAADTRAADYDRTATVTGRPTDRPL
jgi:hypothetical protein